jgi:uncharacterized protein YndB with AHSA1/START domain
MRAKERSNEIKFTRVYDASVKDVWDAWTDPEKVGKWWGPRGFTLTTHSKDLRPGGHWRYTMHGPDGVDYPTHTIYHEVEKQARLVYDHGGFEDRPPLFRVTVTFKEEKGKTRMDMRMAVATPEALEEIEKNIRKASGYSTWDRLAEYLDHELTGKERFVINRSFDASIETMFAMWTDPKHFQRWLAPTGFNMEFIRVDIRPGGDSYYCMSGEGGAKMYGRAQYREIERPSRIVYTQQFSDENEKITRHPMSPTWPETMLTTVTLEAEGPERTRVTVRWEPFGEVTAAELDTFVKARSGMTQGWTGSFDKLEEYVATV